MKFIIFLIGIIITTNNFLHPTADKIFIKDIRYNFFIINDAENIKLTNNILFDSKGRVVGEYKIIDKRSGMALCKIEVDSKIQLSEKFYVKGTVTKKFNEKKNNNYLKINNTKYVKLGDFFVSEKPFSLKQIKNIDNLKNFLIGIENNIGNKYNVSILFDRLIIKNKQFFINKLKKEKYICIVNGILGYVSVLEDDIMFKNISKEILNNFKDKFYFYITLEAK